MSYKKYYVYKKQYSTDSGATWHDYDPTITTPSGDPIATYDTLAECESGSPTPSYGSQYLTLRANSTSGRCKLLDTSRTFYYSVDSGNTWQSATSSSTISLTTGGTLFKGSITSGYIGTFSASTQFTAEGNTMSMIYGDNFVGQTSLSAATFYNLFGGSTITSAENLVLPATALTSGCYSNMFVGCTSLVDAPELPATTLADYCYIHMFDGCTSLTTAMSVLPATSVPSQSYKNMFFQCNALTNTPNISATTLGTSACTSMFEACGRLTGTSELLITSVSAHCCERMFDDCALVNGPSILPATTLAPYCYSGMFAGCTSLTTAPELPAPTLVNYCYEMMFSSCENLNYIKCLAESGMNVNNSTYRWVRYTNDNGTFVKKADVDWPTGNSGIPNGWTVQDA